MGAVILVVNGFLSLQEAIMAEYLNFNDICAKVSFKQALELIGLPYDETQTGVIKGEGFIISKRDGREVYFNPLNKMEPGGSVIQFLSNKQGIGLREAATLLKHAFITETKPTPEPKRQIPTLELEYHPFLKDYAEPDLCTALQVGYCKQKSIMAGRVCFKVGDHYIGYSPEKKDWLFPKGFKRDTIWNIQNCNEELVFVLKDPLKALKFISRGYKNCCSIMGATPTDEQAQTLSKYELVLTDY